jgi:peptidoglycan/LPS O-acetylase OafA/YrhL
VTTPAPTAHKRVFHALDAGRGIAALVVIVFHVPVTLRGHLFGSGDLAVDFFFALSGFVLAHAYLGKLANGQLTVREFIAIRVIRLYPLYLLSLLGLLVLLAVMVTLSRPIPWSLFALAGKLPFAFLMLPSPALDPMGYLYPFNIAAWSIFFELVINIVFALFARQVAQARTRWITIVVSGVVLAAQLLAQDTLGGRSWATLLAGIPRVTFSFLLGVQLYAWHNARAANHAPLAPAWGLAALAALGGCLWLPEHLGVKLAAIFVVFPLLILVLSATQLPQGRVGDALRGFGVLSYAVYAIHSPILFAWSAVSLAWAVAPAMQWLSVLPLLAGIVLASWVADRQFDRPVRSALQRRLRQRSARRAAELAAPP